MSGGGMTGAEAVVAALRSLGVRVVFGIPSVHNLPVVDALARAGGPRFVVARHEQGAATMADGYARAAGALGVCLTSTGPGAANSVASMFEAQVACSPVLQITGQTETRLLDRRRGSVHEIRDQPGMLRAVTKGVLRPLRPEEVGAAVRDAAVLARSGVPGPVVVEVPIDVQYATRHHGGSAGASGGAVADAAPPVPGPSPASGGSAVPTPAPPDPAAVAEAVALIRQARRAVIWAGGGAVRGAPVRLAELAERLGAAVVTSRNGRGAVDEAHPLCVGTLTALPEVRAHLESADVWIAVGSRFRGESTQEWSLPPPRHLVHVNVDPTERDRNYRATVFLAADARAAVDALLAGLDGAGPGAPRAASGGGGDGPLRSVAALAAARAEAEALARSARRSALAALGPWAPAVEALDEALPADAVLVRDATIAAYAFGNTSLLRVHGPGASLSPVGGGLGLGLPLAAGAQAADIDRPVVLICGDGGVMVNLGELATAVQARLPVVILLFNDRCYDVLKRMQDRRFGGRHTAVDLVAPDFGPLCRAFGVPARRVAAVQDLAPALVDALGEARSRSGPVLVEVDLAAAGPIPNAGRH